MEVFVINLNTQPGRMQKMHSRLNAFGIDYIRFPAITSTHKGYFESPHHMGCFLSQQAIIKSCVTRKIDRVLILEDDVLFRSDWLQLLQKSEEYLSCNKWDIFSLGGLVRSPVACTKINENILSVIEVYHAHANIWSLAGMKKFLEVKSWAKYPAFDHLLAESNTFKMLHVNPILVIQGSDDVGRRSIYFKNLFKEDDFRLRCPEYRVE